MSDTLEPITNLGTLLEEQAQQRPEQAAVIVAGKRINGKETSINFQELNELTKVYALGLRKDGVEKGSRVLVMITPSVDLIAVTWSLFRLGAVPILIDPGMGIKRLISCIRRTKPEILVGIPRAHLLSLTFKRSFSSLKKRITVGPKLSLGGSSTKDYKQKPEAWSSDESMSDSDLAAILFTSGSTGSPKGVRYEFKNFASQVSMLKAHFNISPGGKDLPLLPVFALFNPALGLTSVLPRVNPAKPAKLDADHVIDLIQKHQIEHSFGAPVLWKKIARRAAETQKSLDSLVEILVAGSDVSPELVELLKRWTPKARILTPYGATECLPISLIDGKAILNPETRSLNESGQGNCVGKPLPGIDLKIIPPSDQTLESLEDVLECRHDEIGEIIVRGDVVTKAYDKLEEETKLAKIPDGNSFWHRMGDLGYLDKQGYLWYCGRIAHMVETSRGPLYSVCVEAIFNKHPQVYRSALVYLGSKHPPHVPAVVVELENGEKPDPKILSIELQKLGAQHSNTRPIRNFYIHPSFPVDVRHNAKIHRIELSKWAAKQDPLPSV